MRTLTDLYANLAEQHPPEQFHEHIQQMMKNQDWIIFSEKKV
jgi:hypothetical protein